MERTEEEKKAALISVMKYAKEQPGYNPDLMDISAGRPIVGGTYSYKRSSDSTEKTSEPEKGNSEV